MAPRNVISGFGFDNLVSNVIIDTARNRAAYTSMAALVRSGRALAFVGAGVTAPLGYPSWPHLIKRLAAEVRSAGREEIRSNGQALSVEQVLRDLGDDPLMQAQILKEHLGERYFSVMSELFGPKEERIAPIADLVTLPFKHILTSNYDPGLELHHKPAEKPLSICLHHDAAREFITSFADEHYARHVVHVHGRYDEPKFVILTEEDYAIYVCSPVFDQFWYAIPLARLVFFGFSFADLDLLYSFRRVRMALQGNDQGNARHFAIMGLDDVTRDELRAFSLKRKYGIEPVFFPQQGASFQEYDDLLSTLKLEIIGTRPDQLAEAAAAAAVGPAPEAEPEIAATQGQEPIADAVREGVERLTQMTRANITRRQTGDLE